ncbi:MAG: cytochrome ubiquinol oxidase subunit I [Chlamydiales bacterium]|nr:cytochrome ubiquinol oxidase subunit I [Chlamydiia bacterium]MCP5506715.1 cytochrome ubiquinol oxidase subunit I [Chlamydiales bacterium]
MDVEILARVQFALTIMFHYIYPPLSIGLGLVLVITEGLYMKTGDTKYHLMARFWTRIFALTFAIGVATGIVMEFEFGTNWATYSKYVGDVFGSALAAEGVFAFFLESGFLAILLFGWDRVKPITHFISTIMVCLGAHFSAIWIIVANSWMQTPAGYHIVGEGLNARAEITDFWAMVFNPSSMTRLGHVVIGCWLAGAFLVISIAAYYMIKERHRDFARTSMKIGLSIAGFALILQLFSGDRSGKEVAEHQPAKLAALEGVFNTTRGAPLILFGIPNPAEEKVDFRVAIPKLLSFLAFENFNAEVMGLDQVPAKDRPNVSVIFQTYRLMLAMWGIMVILTIVAIWKYRRGTLEKSKGFLWLLVLGVLAPQIANQTGWISAEMGRYPWIVYNLLRISDGLSKTVLAEHIIGSLIMFTLLYMMLFILFIYLLNHKIKHGPEDGKGEGPYHSLQQLVKEKSHD